MTTCSSLTRNYSIQQTILRFGQDPYFMGGHVMTTRSHNQAQLVALYRPYCQHEAGIPGLKQAQTNIPDSAVL